MKTWKLVSGILSIVLFAVVCLQSCASGMYDALTSVSTTGSAAGTLVAMDLLAGGIVSIVTRNSEKKGGDIALIVIFILAAIIGFTMAGSYADLRVWAVWCVINVITAVIDLRQK